MRLDAENVVYASHEECGNPPSTAASASHSAYGSGTNDGSPESLWNRATLWNHATLVSNDESLASPSTPNDCGHYEAYHFLGYPDLHEAYEAWKESDLEPLGLNDCGWSG